MNRSEQKPQDCWDLEKMYAEAQIWENELKDLQAYIPEIEAFKGRLAESPEVFADCLDRIFSSERKDEKLGNWVFLKMSEDGGDSERQARYGRYMAAAVKLQTASSWFQPELMSLDSSYIETCRSLPRFKDYGIFLEKILRYKDHTLSANEERILSIQEEANQTSQRAFSALCDVDMNFGNLETEEGSKELTHSSFAAFLQQSDRPLREKAYRQYYGVYDDHKNTLATLYLGSVQKDVVRARVRNYPSSLEAALFHDKVAPEVYTTLISTVREFFPALHKYYNLRKQVLKLDTLELWDVRAGLFPEIKTRYGYEEAVDLVIAALSPLGSEYTGTIKDGLLGSWVDRYENKGKRSGAFSSGGYDTDPYILMNYKETVLGDVFTLAHEGGHSMHSWYSVRNNPFPHYHYTIFEAEVASTFNEELLFHHLLKTSKDSRLRLFLLNKHLEDIIATIFRQTMFAEFEMRAHSRVEQGESLSLEDLRQNYRSLLEDWFGPEVRIDPLADLEGLRIPHFYRAFYVYKYATGLSAAMALSKRVLEGGQKELDDYLGFLKRGGSSYPIENLKLAGVDMAKPEAVRSALSQFSTLVDELRASLL